MTKAESGVIRKRANRDITTAYHDGVLVHRFQFWLGPDHMLMMSYLKLWALMLKRSCHAAQHSVLLVGSGAPRTQMGCRPRRMVARVTTRGRGEGRALFSQILSSNNEHHEQQPYTRSSTLVRYVAAQAHRLASQTQLCWVVALRLPSLPLSPPLPHLSFSCKRKRHTRNW